jgi:hypothetical protein
MFGYEAFFFEKYVNLRHFDEIIYRQMIAQSAKALVEKRFNQLLFGLNIKKQEGLGGSLSQFSIQGDEHDKEARHDDRREGLQRVNSVNAIRDRRNVGMRRRQSSRSLFGGELGPERMRSSRNLLEDEKKEDGVKKSHLSREKLIAVRRELLGGDDNQKRPSAGNDISDGPRRSMAGRRQGSNRRISNIEDLHDSCTSMRLSPSRPSLMEQQQQGEGGMERSSPRNGLEGAMKRSSSRNSLMPREHPRERGMGRASSQSKLLANHVGGGEDRRNAMLRQGSGRSLGRHRLSNRNISASVDIL